MSFYLPLPAATLAAAVLTLWAARGRLDEALLWSAVAGAAVVYPTTRYAVSLEQPQRAQRLICAVGGLCCAGGLVVLWALGAPIAAMVLLICGLLAALVGMAVRPFPSPYVALAAFAGGVVFMYSWWGLGIWALGAWLSRGQRCAPVIAAWAGGLALAWLVYVPLESLWSLLNFLTGLPQWLSG
jgi:hypothetical protein